MATNESLTRIPDAQVALADVTTAPINRSVTGYGSKIPTCYRLRIGSRWHRVYAICFSNTSTVYIIKQGMRLFLEMETEHRLQVQAEHGAR